MGWLAVGLGVASFLAGGAPGGAQTTNLDESCVVSAFNRTAPVQADGSWVLPDVPTALGPARIHAICVRDGQTTPEGEGQICDGQGNCVGGVDLLPKICDKVDIDTSLKRISRNETPPNLKQCTAACFFGVKLTFNKVTTTCSDADFKGATYGENEELRLVSTTCSKGITDALTPKTGRGGRIIKGNKFKSTSSPKIEVGDFVTVCGPQGFSTSCTVKFERDVFIGPCKVRTYIQTRTIGPTCDDYHANL